jgi:hypothetical protein
VSGRRRRDLQDISDVDAGDVAARYRTKNAASIGKGQRPTVVLATAELEYERLPVGGFFCIRDQLFAALLHREHNPLWSAEKRSGYGLATCEDCKETSFQNWGLGS